MKYNNLTLGRVEALVNKLGGEGMVERFLDGSHPLQQASLDEIRVRQHVPATTFTEQLAALRRRSWIYAGPNWALVQECIGETEIVFVHCHKKEGLDLAGTPLWMRERGLVFVEPLVLMAWNAAHPEFSKTCPNLTQYSDERLFPIAAKFEWWRHNQAIFELQEQQHRSWGSNWWFAGRPIL